MRTLTDEIVDSMVIANAPIPRPVAEIDLETKKVIQIFRSIKQASDMTGIDRHTISHVCNGKYKQIKGRKFVWVRSIIPT